MVVPLTINSASTLGATAKPEAPIAVADHHDGVLPEDWLSPGPEGDRLFARWRSVPKNPRRRAAAAQPRAAVVVSASARLDEYGFDAALCGDMARPPRSSTVRSTTAYENCCSSSWGSVALRDVEVLRVGDRQRTQHDCVDKRKNGAARSDPKRQRQDRDCGETGASARRRAPKRRSLEQMFDGSERAHVAAGLLHGSTLPIWRRARRLASAASSPRAISKLSICSR